MQRFFQLLLISICLLSAWNIQAQREVLIEASDDLASPTDLFPVIMGDTTATGERTDVNTVYKLQNGNVYVLSDRIDSDGGWHVQIEAEDLNDLVNKPVITRVPNASGDRPKIIYARGDMTLRNLWIISGENGPLEQHHWGQIRMFGENSRVVVEDCLIEKDRGGFLQLRANGVKCYVSRCTFRNGGNRRILEGNGRGIDARTFFFDTLVVSNTIIHNIIDRVFRSHGGTQPHNYIEWDHNTVFNHAGRHGGFQFGRARTVKITNNLFINPNMLGTSPQYTDEQLQPDADKHKLFTVDTLYSDTEFTFGNNNIFWTQDVLDFYESVDTVERVPIYSDLILQSMGNDGAGTYFEDVVTLNNTPVSLLQYVQDLYANPAAEDMFDFVVESTAVAGTPFDNGHLYDFSMFDPCYPTDAASATGDSGGGAVGAVAFCEGLTAGEEVLGTVVDVVVESDVHNILEQAVIAAGLAETLSGDGPFTVFAPTDAAFGLLPDGTVETLLMDPMGQLAEILKYHVLGAKVLSSDLSNGQTAVTLQGSSVTVRIEDGNVFINDAMVSMADIEASNGVVHVLDAVLLPPEPQEPARYVLIESSGDPFNPRDIFPVIMGDTTETGERMGANTIYQLENGVVYVLSDRLESTGGWPLQIEAVDLENTALKPVITRIPNASGDRPKIAYARGDMMLRNLWIISGENGPLEQHHWGQIRMFGENSRVIVEDCLIEKDRGGFLQLRANGVKLYVDNCVFRNGGNRRILEGNGRGIDARTFYFDTLVVTNTIIHNIIDRVFRSHGGTQPHNYVEWDHNTVFNHTGRHGGFQFGRVNTAKITNNLFISPNMLGTSPQYTDEQLQPDNDKHKLFTVDTLYEGTNFTFANNNIFWTQDVLDFYASVDTVERVPIYSDLIIQSMGNDGTGTYFTEEVTLANVPVSLLQYVQDLYANPAAEDMFDFVVEDSLLAGTVFDSGNLFNFANFDPCYDSDTQSATGDTNGGAVGAVGACDMLTSVFERNINPDLGLEVAPNPVSGFATVRYFLPNRSFVRLSVYDMTGREIQTLVNSEQLTGEYTVNWERTSRLAKGIYVMRLQTEFGQHALKVSVR